MEGAALSRDVPYTTPEQQELAEWVDDLFKKYDTLRHRTFDLEVQRILAEHIKKERNNGAA